MLNNRVELLEIIKFGNDIKKVINKWDPLNLLFFTPDDEYETEIRAIRETIIVDKITDTNELSSIIKNIFKNFFGEEYNSKKNIEDYISKKILNLSRKYSLFGINLNKVKEYKINMGEINQYANIKKIINKWDPLDIMNIALSNEYCNEINSILKIADKTLTILKLSNEINNIFKNSYNGIYDVKKYEEIKIAKKIRNIKLKEEKKSIELPENQFSNK